MSDKTTKAAEPKRNVLCRVTARGGIKLPPTKHRLGCGHELALTKQEADDAVEAGLVKIIGLA